MIKNRLDAAMGNPTAWRLHDLRRTFVTGLADLGIRPDVIVLAVNHRSGLRGGIAGVYNKSELLHRAARGVGALGRARRRPRSREAHEGGVDAHGGKVRGPRHAAKGGAPVAATNDEHVRAKPMPG